MIILGLDTASDWASVAVRADGRTLAEEAVAAREGQSQIIFSLIEQVLRKSGVSLPEVDCFAACHGPGSFTGVRICVAAAKGLAEAQGKPAAGISRLRALAALGTSKLRNPRIDARRGQLYTAIYDDQQRVISPEIVIGTEDWLTPVEVEQIDSLIPLASVIAACAEFDGPERWIDPAMLDANYVRRADAEMHWAER